MGLVWVGIGLGDWVGIWVLNWWEWVFVQYVIVEIGVILVIINFVYWVCEVEYVFRQFGVVMVIVVVSFKDVDYVVMLVEVGL